MLSFRVTFLSVYAWNNPPANITFVDPLPSVMLKLKTHLF